MIKRFNTLFLFLGTIFASPIYITFLGIPVILGNYESSALGVKIGHEINPEFKIER